MLVSWPGRLPTVTWDVDPALPVHDTASSDPRHATANRPPIPSTMPLRRCSVTDGPSASPRRTDSPLALAHASTEAHHVGATWRTSRPWNQPTPGPRRGTTIRPMTKRTMLWTVGALAFAFTFLGAANVRQYSQIGGAHLAACNEGLSSVRNWFTSTCSDPLLPRLGSLAIGAIILVACGYFAEEGVPRQQREARHRVYRDARDQIYWCSECSMTTADTARAAEHVGYAAVVPFAPLWKPRPAEQRGSAIRDEEVSVLRLRYVRSATLERPLCHVDPAFTTIR
jgi:hypothetical protein